MEFHQLNKRWWWGGEKCMEYNYRNEWKQSDTQSGYTRGFITTNMNVFNNTRYCTSSTTDQHTTLPGALQVGLCHSSVVDATLFSVM